jgi:hypothetical protein
LASSQRAARRKLRVFLRRRRMHQHRAAAPPHHAEIAAERGIAGQRFDAARRPAGMGQERLDPIGRSLLMANALAIRPGKTMACRPFSAISNRVKGTRLVGKPPAWSGHSAISTAPYR